ncbi:SCP2 sterol-binding domain-containing protein [bacterium]|nr:SCP2 sterol-binding domain-containing protein [bacterium]
MNDLERCEYYLRDWLPPRLSANENQLLDSIGVPVSFDLHEGKESRRFTVQKKNEGLAVLEEAEPVCTYRLAASTFLKIAAGDWSPQRAVFTGKLRIGGDKLLAVRLGSLLESVFRRIPWDGSPASTLKATISSVTTELTPHQRAMLALHMDPKDGSRYWVERSSLLGIEPQELRTIEDLAAFGPMDRQAMSHRPWRDFVPMKLLRTGGEFTLGETGGTTGDPVTAAWSAKDFEAGFVTPLLSELGHRELEMFAQWLFVGPTGPHIIGKAADALARRTSGIDALKVDFDPRWHRTMLPGSTASLRHREHLVRQAMALLERESVDALFITPSVLQVLLEKHSGPWIANLRLVHLGGQSITRDEREWLAGKLPAHCALINGYGNSLFGCLIEDATRPLRYRTAENRVAIRLLRNPENLRDFALAGETGRVLFHRFDESMLLLNCVERDEADACESGFESPRPARETASAVAGGIY